MYTALLSTNTKSTYVKQYIIRVNDWRKEVQDKEKCKAVSATAKTLIAEKEEKTKML